MIIISKPEVLVDEQYATLQAKIEIDNRQELLWFKVNKKYSQYLCWERSDAFVIGVLDFAMRNGHNITCLAPMGEDLHYQITNYQIEAVYKGSTTLYKTKIFSEIDSSLLKNAGGVGTGISCGIDSFHVLANNANSIYRNHQLTHLTFNNVGSHGDKGRDNSEVLFFQRRARAESFCKEYGFEFLESDSNIMDICPQRHIFSHTYRGCFAVYCLQKLYSVYYYASSGMTFTEFSLYKNDEKDMSSYDLLTLYSLSSNQLKLYSEGGAFTRIAKTVIVAEYEPSYKYLNVCILQDENCGICEKCARTLLTLDSIGKLHLYKDVFNIDFYYKNLSYYLIILCSQIWVNKLSFYKSLYPYFKNKISFLIRIKAFIKCLEMLTSKHIKNQKVRNLLKLAKKAFNTK